MASCSDGGVVGRFPNDALRANDASDATVDAGSDASVRGVTFPLWGPPRATESCDLPTALSDVLLPIMPCGSLWTAKGATPLAEEESRSESSGIDEGAEAVPAAATSRPETARGADPGVPAFVVVAAGPRKKDGADAGAFGRGAKIESSDGIGAAVAAVVAVGRTTPATTAVAATGTGFAMTAATTAGADAGAALAAAATASGGGGGAISCMRRSVGAATRCGQRAADAAAAADGDPAPLTLWCAKLPVNPRLAWCALDTTAVNALPMSSPVLHRVTLNDASG